MSFKKSIKVFIGIPSLRDDDKYKPYLGSCLKHIVAQDCPVETMKPYVTLPTLMKWNVGEKSRHNAIMDRLNNIVDEYMVSDASHLWIVDADVEVPPHALCTLLKLDVDLASGVYSFHNNRRATLFGRMPDTEKYNYAPRDIGFFRGRVLGEHERVGGGSGCMLIKRRVFNRYHPQVPPLRFTSPRGEGSDVYFWYRAQVMGFTARVTGNVICGHLPEHGLSIVGDYQ